MEKILTTEVNREESLCRPMVTSGFMLPTI